MRNKTVILTSLRIAIVVLHSFVVSGQSDFLVLRQEARSQAASMRTVHTGHRELQSSSDAGVLSVHSGPQVVQAFLDPAVHTILLSASPIVLTYEYFEASFASLPFLLKRNLTIRGDSTLPEWPTLDLAFIKGVVKLAHGIRLVWQEVILDHFKADSIARVLGMDLLAQTDKDSFSYMDFIDIGAVLEACYREKDMTYDMMTSIARPPNAPPMRMRYPVSQEGCINDTSQPHDKRCWAIKGVMDSDTGYGVTDINGLVVPLNMVTSATNVIGYCKRVVSDECTAREGTAYFCLQSLLREALLKERSPPPSKAHSTQANGLAIGLAVGLGAGLLLLVGAGVVAVAVLRRRRALRQALETSGGLSRLPKPLTQGCEQKLAAPDPEGLACSSRQHLCSPCSSASVTEENITSKKEEACVFFPPERMESRRSTVMVMTDGDVADAPVTRQAPTRSDLQMNVRLEEGSKNPANGEQHPTVRRGAGDCVIPDTSTGSRAGADSPATVYLLPVVRGAGAFGQVTEGMYGDQRVAVKMLREVLAEDEQSELIFNSFKQEVQVLGRCRHPNVVRLLAACVQPPRMCLVLELMETSLDKVLYANASRRGYPNNPLPLAKALHIGIEVSRALAYLHPTIVHRDLKPANVLINDPSSDRPVVKLTDFGLSRLRDSIVPTERPDAGTTPYMAPECFETIHRVITHKADIYSLGVLLWEMLAAQQPWAGVGCVAIAYSVAHDKSRLPLGLIPPDRMTRKISRLLEECWEQDPLRRPAASEVAKELTLALQQLRAEGENANSEGPPLQIMFL